MIIRLYYDLAVDLCSLKKNYLLTLKKNISLIKFSVIGVMSFFLPVLFSSAKVSKQLHTSFISAPITVPDVSLYATLALDSLGLSREAFNEAVTGYVELQKTGNIQNSDVLSIVDFSQPSFKKRLFILDMINGRLLFNTVVAHGRNSGKVLASKFSNRSKSLESSLGFYLTGETYMGRKGYSLRLVGMEQGINDHAYARGIVVHAARYVNEENALLNGQVGRSEGCPAIPVNIHRALIEKIKNGSCFFIYGQDKKYPTHSKLLKTQSVS